MFTDRNSRHRGHQYRRRPHHVKEYLDDDDDEDAEDFIGLRGLGGNKPISNDGEEEAGGPLITIEEV